MFHIAFIIFEFLYCKFSDLIQIWNIKNAELKIIFNYLWKIKPIWCYGKKGAPDYFNSSVHTCIFGCCGKLSKHLFTFYKKDGRFLSSTFWMHNFSKFHCRGRCVEYETMGCNSFFNCLTLWKWIPAMPAVSAPFTFLKLSSMNKASSGFTVYRFNNSW